MGSFSRIFCAILFGYILCSSCHGHTDETIVPKAKGQPVADAVVQIVGSIFGDDKDFLRRVGWVESKFGLDPNTYRSGYYGGIWQVDLLGFQSTQATKDHPALLIKYKQIKDSLGIDWSKVKYDDLLKPLYSGLAARLFISNIPTPIPDSVEDQAQYWKTYYNTRAGKGSAQDFVDRVNDLEKKAPCRSKMNIVAALDGSGSVGVSNFDQGKKAISTFFQGMSRDRVHFGFLVFSDSVDEIFDLHQTFKDEVNIDQKVMSAKYPAGGTRTDLAINHATKLLMEAEDVSGGTPNVLLVLTDGQSNMDVAASAQNAWSSGITSCAVGIGSDINSTELHVIGHENVFEVTAFNSLKNFLTGRIARKACTVPQTPTINTTVSDSLQKEENRYYNYPIPHEGLTFDLKNIQGQTKAYYSYTFPIPSSALNDGILQHGLTFIPPKVKGPERQKRAIMIKEAVSQIYLAIEGIEAMNNYTLSGVNGDGTGSSGSSIGWIIGITVFVILGIILGAVAFIIYKRRRHGYSTIQG